MSKSKTSIAAISARISKGKAGIALTHLTPSEPAFHSVREFVAKTPITPAAVAVRVASNRSVLSWSRFQFLALVFLSSVGISASGGSGPVALPDPAQGEIDGRVAVTILPAKSNNGKLEALSPLGYVAHLTGYDDPNLELAYPCGIWFQPPSGRYRAWVEGEWQISGYSTVVSYSGQVFRGRGLASAVPVVDAGLVALPPGVAETPALVLRLLHAGSYLEGKFPRWELSRRLPVRQVGRGLLMPAGPTIGALWDDRSQRYVALSRPFEVKARQTVTVPFERLEGVVHLVAQIQRNTLAGTAQDLNTAVTLTSQGKALSPDHMVEVADRTYAVWYDLTPGSAEIQASWKEERLEVQNLDLQAGQVERFMGKMKPRPLSPLELPVRR